MESDYKHWKNCDVPGQTSYITCTCLDFARLLYRKEMRTRMASHILEACRHHDSRLHAFVVMSHHIHLLMTPSESQTMSQFMRSFKSFSAKSMIPELNAYERAQLKQQIGLNDRSFWKVSFRGLPVYSEKVFGQKVNYIHDNPVRSDYVASAELYPWSSCMLYDLGLHDGENGIDFSRSIEFYQLLLKLPS